jgi:multicomponent Na+:H+ antiporter subunit F
MAEFLFAAAGFILLMVALGLFGIFRGRAEADRLMAAQLIGSGGVAMLLLAVATQTFAVIDVALMLALLAAFASVAFVNNVGAKASTADMEIDP